MKTVLKKVYFCDFCSKRGLGAGQMRKHEKHCTANPCRECRVCGCDVHLKGLVDYYKSLFELKINIPANRIGNMGAWLDAPEHSHFVIWADRQPTLLELRTAVNNCPMCLFALIRQVGFNKHYFKDAYKIADFRQEVVKAIADKISVHDLPF